MPTCTHTVFGLIVAGVKHKDYKYITSSVRNTNDFWYLKTCKKNVSYLLTLYIISLLAPFMCVCVYGIGCSSWGCWERESRGGGKARVLMCTWIVPGCLALSVVHLRWSVTHTHTFTLAETGARMHAVIHTHFQGHTYTFCLSLCLSLCYTHMHNLHLHHKMLIYREVYLFLCDPVTATPGSLSLAPSLSPSQQQHMAGHPAVRCVSWGVI